MFGDSGLVWCGSSGIGESGSNLKAEAMEFAARSNKRCEKKSCQKRVQGFVAKLRQHYVR